MAQSPWLLAPVRSVSPSPRLLEWACLALLVWLLWHFQIPGSQPTCQWASHEPPGEPTWPLEGSIWGSQGIFEGTAPFAELGGRRHSVLCDVLSCLGCHQVGFRFPLGPPFLELAASSWQIPSAGLRSGRPHADGEAPQPPPMACSKRLYGAGMTNAGSSLVSSGSDSDWHFLTVWP